MSSYKLNYFNARGRAELTRLVFAAAGVSFTDNRVEFGDWAGLKEQAPIGQMPYLEINDTKLPQSITIARFVAREHGLAGSTNLRQAQADAIVDTITDLINFYYSKVFPIQDAAEKEAAFKAFMGDQGAKGAANIEKLISLYGSNGYSVGDSLTWADLFIYDLTAALLSKNPDFTNQYPLIASVHQTVSNNEKVSNYVKNRPVTPF